MIISFFWFFLFFWSGRRDFFFIFLILGMFCFFFFWFWVKERGIFLSLMCFPMFFLVFWPHFWPTPHLKPFFAQICALKNLGQWGCSSGQFVACVLNLGALPTLLPRTALSRFHPLPPDRPKWGFTRQPENSKCAHLTARRFRTPPKFHETTPKRRKKERNTSGKEKAKFGLPTLQGPPTLRDPPRPLLRWTALTVSVVCAVLFLILLRCCFSCCCFWAADRRPLLLPPLQCLTFQNVNNKFLQLTGALWPQQNAHQNSTRAPHHLALICRGLASPAFGPLCCCCCVKNTPLPLPKCLHCFCCFFCVAIFCCRLTLLLLFMVLLLLLMLPILLLLFLLFGCCCCCGCFQVANRWNANLCPLSTFQNVLLLILLFVLLCCCCLVLLLLFVQLAATLLLFFFCLHCYVFSVVCLAFAAAFCVVVRWKNPPLPFLTFQNIKNNFTIDKLSIDFEKSQ